MSIFDPTGTGELDRNNLPINKRKTSNEIFRVPTSTTGGVARRGRTDIFSNYPTEIDSAIAFRPDQNREDVEARYQGYGELLAKAAAQFAGEVTLGTLEGVGYLLDLEQYSSIADGTEKEFSNWFSDIMQQGKEYINEEIAPIAQTEAAQQGFAPTDASWWGSNAATIGSTLALLIPAAGAARGVSLLGKGARLIGRAGKLANIADDASDAVRLGNTLLYGKKAENISRGVSSAVFSRYMENTMEAQGTYAQTYQELLAQGIHPDEARLKAGEAAATAWENNWVNLAFDVVQYMTLTKGMNSANFASKEFRKGVLKKGGIAALNVGQEAVEEGLQFVISEEAKRKAIKGSSYEGLKDITTRIGDYLEDPDMKAAMLLGAVGGGVFTGARGLYNKIQDIGTQTDYALAKGNALDEGRETDVAKYDGATLANEAYAHAKQGKLNDLKAHYKDLGSATDEELIAQGKSPQEIEDIRRRDKEIQEDIDFIGNEYVRLENDTTKTGRLKVDELSSRYEKRILARVEKQTSDKLNATKEQALKENMTSEEYDKKEKEITISLLKAYKKLIDTGKAEKTSFGADFSKKVQNRIDDLTKELEDMKEVKVKPSSVDPELNKQLNEKVKNLLNNDHLDSKLQQSEDPKKQAEYEAELKQMENDKLLSVISDDIAFENIDKLLANDNIKTEAKKKLKALADKAEKNSPIPSGDNVESDMDKRYSSTPLLYKDLQRLGGKLYGQNIRDIKNLEDFKRKYNSNKKFRDAVDRMYADMIDAATRQQNTNAATPSKVEEGNAAKPSEAILSDTNNPTDKSILLSHEYAMYVRKGDTVFFVGAEEDSQMTVELAESLDKYKELKEGGFHILYTKDDQPVKSAKNTLTLKDGTEVPFMTDRDFEVLNDPDIEIYGSTISFEIPMDNKWSPDNSGPDYMVVIPTIIVNGEKIQLGKLKGTNLSDTKAYPEIKELRQQLYQEWKKSGTTSGIFVSQNSDIKVGVRTSGHFNISGNNKLAPHTVTDKIYLGIVARDNHGGVDIIDNEGYRELGIDPSSDISYNKYSKLNDMLGSVVMFIRSADGIYRPVKLETVKLKELEAETEEVNKLVDALFNDQELLSAPQGSDTVKTKIQEFNAAIKQFVFLNIVYDGNGKFTSISNTETGKERVTYTDAQTLKDALQEKVMRVDKTLINTKNYKGGLSYNNYLSEKGWIKTNISPGAKTLASQVKLDMSGFDKGKKVEKTREKEVGEATSKENIETPSDTQDTVQNQGSQKEGESVKPIGSKRRRSGARRGKDEPKKRVAVGTYEKWDSKKELAWFKKNYPNVPVEVLKDLKKISDEGGPALWGLFKNGAVYIAQNAATGTLYHEAFHVVFNTLLNEKEREVLLNEFRGKDELDKEENMSDYFMDYKLTQGNEESGLSAKVIDFFKRLYHLIQIAAERVGIKGTASVDDYMYRTDKGLYNIFNINKKFSRDVSRFRVAENSGKMNSREESMGVETLNAVMINDVIPEYRDALGLSSELSNEDVVREILKVGREKKDNTYSLQGMYATVHSFIKDEMDEFSDEFTEDGVDYLNKLLDTLAAVDDNGNYTFGPILARAANDLGMRFGIGISMERISSDDAVQMDEKLIEGWMVKESFNAHYDKFSSRAKIAFATVRKGEDPADYTIYESPSIVYSKLARHLVNSANEQDMMQKIDELVEMYPDYTSVKELMLKDDNLRGEMWMYMGSKKSVEFIGQTTERNNTSKTFGSNRRSATRDLISTWQSDVYNSPLYDKSSNSISLDATVVDSIDTLIKEVKSVRTQEASDNHIENLNDILKKMNIFISKNSLNRLFGVHQGRKRFLEFIGSNKKGLRDIAINMSKGIDPFVESDIEQHKSLTNMATIIRDGINDLFQMSFRSMGEKQIYSQVDNRFHLNLINKLKHPLLKDVILEQYRKDPFYSQSPILELFDNLVTSDDVRMAYIDGHRDVGTNAVTEYSDMTPQQLEVFQLNAWFKFDTRGKQDKNAYYMLPVLADSSSAAFIHAPKLKDSSVREALVRTAIQERDRIAWLERRITPVKEEYENWLENGGEVPIALSDIPYSVLKGGLKYQVFKGLDGVTENNFYDTVNKMLDKKLASERALLEEDGILEHEWLDKRVKSNIDSHLDNYLLNRMYMNLQTMFLFNGDPVYYKIEDGNVDYTDVYKRVKQIHSPQNIISVDDSRKFVLEDGTQVGVRPNYNVSYVIDPTDVKAIESDHIGVIEEIFPDDKWIHKKCRELNNTDAATLIDIFRMREIYIGTAKWTPVLQEQYDAIMQGNSIPFNKDEQIKVLKPFNYTHRPVKQSPEHDELRMVPTQHKNSEMLLTPQMAVGNPKLKSILTKMGYTFKDDGTFTFNENDRITDAVMFTSAVKVGQFRNVSSIDDIDSKNVHRMNNSDYAIQQETPEHYIDAQSNYGSQIRKLMTQDLDKSAIYNVNGTDMTGQQLFDVYQEAISKNVTEAFKKLKKMFYKEDGSPDLEAIVSILRKEVVERQMGEGMLDALEWLDDNKTETMLPLWHPHIVYNVEAIMNSFFKNNVTKQKINGPSLYNATSWGFEKGNKQGLRKPEIIIERDSEGNPYIKEVEVLMPIQSKKIFEKYTDENGRIDVNDVPDSLKMGIFYRIPTEGKYSMFHIKVIGYLEGVGGQMVMPDEVTTIAGLDFDIDKVFGMMYNFKSTKEGLEKIPSSMDSKKGRDNLLIDLQYAIMSHPSTIRKQLTPGNYNTLDAVKKEVLKLEGKDSVELNPMLPSTQREVFNRNMVGASLIGIGANHNATHAIMSEGDFRFRTPISFNGEEFNSLSDNKNVNGNFISSALAEFLAAYVDNAKDPIASFLNLTTTTADAVATMIRTGHDPVASMLLMASPAAKQFSRLLAENGDTSRSAIHSTLKKLLDTTREEIIIVGSKESLEEYMEKKLKDRLNISTIKKSFNRDSSLQQLHTDFSIYQLLGSVFEKTEALVDTMNAIRFDSVNNSAGPTMAHTDVQKKKFERALEIDGSVIIGLKNFIDSGKMPYVKDFYSGGIEMLNTEDKNIIMDVAKLPYDKPIFSNIVNLFNVYSNISGNGNLDVNATNQLYRYIMSIFNTGYETFGHQDTEQVISKLPQQVRDYQKSDPEGPYSNFINNFIVSAADNNIPFSYLKFNRNGLDKYRIDDMQKTWSRMLNSNVTRERNLAHKLIQYAFYSTGYTRTFNTFADIVPPSFMAQLNDTREHVPYREFVSNMYNREFSTYEMQQIVDQIVRNGYRSMRAVPFMDPRQNRDISIREIDGEKVLVVPSKYINKKRTNPITGESSTVIKYVKAPIKTKDGVTTVLFSSPKFDSNNNAHYTMTTRLGIHNQFVEFNMKIIGTEQPLISIYPTVKVELEKETTEEAETLDRADAWKEIAFEIKKINLPAVFSSEKQKIEASRRIENILNSMGSTIESITSVKKEEVEDVLEGDDITTITELPEGAAEEIIKRCKGK